MIVLQNVSKIFQSGATGLSDVSLVFERGEFVFVTGQTGSGKTTLLKLIIREYLPTDGSIFVEDVDLVKLPKKKIPHFRKSIGMVFQDLKLLSDRTILENVLLPLEIAGVKDAEAVQKTETLLEDVGVGQHKFKFPQQLSGGELQRVAIARALTLDPTIIIADEPTGNLDNETAMAIVDLLHKINKEKGTTIVMVTHNSAIVEKFSDHHTVVLEKGKVVKDTKKKEEIKKEEHKPTEKKHHGHKDEEVDVKKQVFEGTIEEKLEEKKELKK